jgi:hypothetical protein
LSFAPPRNGGSGVDVELERMERMRLHIEPVVDGGARIEEEAKNGSWVLWRRNRYFTLIRTVKRSESLTRLQASGHPEKSERVSSIWHSSTRA